MSVGDAVQGFMVGLLRKHGFDDYESAMKEVTRLRAIVQHYPVTADGYSVYPGMWVYHYSRAGWLKKRRVVKIHYGGNLIFQHRRIRHASGCFGSKVAAMESGMRTHGLENGADKHSCGIIPQNELRREIAS